MVVLTAGLAIACAFAATASAAPPAIGGCQLFPAFSGSPTAPSAADQTAWNQDVSQAPVRANSGAIVKRINQTGGRFLHPDFGSNPDYGIPFDVAPQSQPDARVVIGPNGYPDESDFGVGSLGPDTAPIPPTAHVEAGSDRHALIVHQGECGLYEMGRAKYLGGAQHTWQADATAFFDLTQAGPLRNGGDYITSADAAGLPILPGLVRYDEVAAGEIDHAIRVTFDVTRAAYYHPATHWASSECGRTLPAMGLRLRMKAGYYNAHLAEFPPGSQSRVVFTALRHYGVLNADNGSNWFITGQTSPSWDDGDLNALKGVPGRAFEVLKNAAPVTTDC